FKYISLTTDELTSNNRESSVDIIAASGAAKTIPASQPGKTSNAINGITWSAISIPGKIGLAKTPIKCIFNIIKPTTIVPITHALCIDLESRYDLARIATCGNATTPTPTNIQKDETYKAVNCPS